MASCGIPHRVVVQTLRTVNRSCSVLTRLSDSTIRAFHPSQTCSRPYCFRQQLCHHHDYRLTRRHAISGARSSPWCSTHLERPVSTSSTLLAEATVNPLTDTDPFKLAADEVKDLRADICKVLEANEPKMQEMAQYYFSRGKMFRPMVCMLMSKLCNNQNNMGDSVLPSQRIIAMVMEMLHSASLIHDDVVDAADERRNMKSLNMIYGQRRSILAGNFIHTQASKIISSIGNSRVIALHATAVEDIISGEFLQLHTKEDESERFKLYMKKTHKKTASPLACYNKCVAILSNVDETLIDAAYSYGYNFGMSYQIIDDVLDFVGQEKMGKPTDSDLKMGMVNAPVLFAAMECQDLHPVIMRRFSEPGDVEYARDMIKKTSALDRTRDLAAEHIEQAIRSLDHFTPCPARDALAQVPLILSRRKV
ncbi:hypothetical protein RRG08_015604 [Elysia crispata]|uniref:Uncharacterized protein n=1 Tax=Elysia crispata TaxID=231223 RepID=A0AAE0YJ66_9GAST|nr:hypothetical protein RRG08_015604 [Elysia crispata]